MRFNLPAGRTMASLLGLALAASAAACSGSGSSSAASPAATSASASVPASSPAPPAPVAPAASAASAASATATSTGNASAAPEIKGNWEKFFNASTPASQKVALLQNGTEFQSAVETFAAMPIAGGLGAKVNAVVVNSATTAAVNYDLTKGAGATLLPNQVGTSVYQDGTWKVGDATLCALLKLTGGDMPAACKAA